MVEPRFQMEKDRWANETSVSPRPPPTGQVETIWGSPLPPQMGTEPRGYTDHLSVAILWELQKVISSGSSAEASGIPEFQIAHSPPLDNFSFVSVHSTCGTPTAVRCGGPGRPL